MQVSYTAENLLEALEVIIDSWELKEKNITFVTDNASDIKKATAYHGGYTWLSCGGHVLNLVAQAGFDTAGTKKIINKCKNIVTFIKKAQLQPMHYVVTKIE